MRFAALGMTLAVLGCAHDEATPRKADPVVTPAPKPSNEAAAERDIFAGPQSIDEVGTRYEFECPAPVFRFPQAQHRNFGTHPFVIEGTHISRESPMPLAHPNTFVLGLIGAPKDATEPTQKNMRAIATVFADAGVDAVLVNGDLGENAEINDVMRMLATSFPSLLFVHAGNIEWAANFTDALARTEKQAHTHIVNMNWFRHVSLGPVELVALPGYHDARYARSGACQYDDDDLAATTTMLNAAHQSGHPVLFSSHGPPRSRGEYAIDFAFEAGNVGDEDLAAMLTETHTRFGLFGHILEAGGRASTAVAAFHEKPITLSDDQPQLFVNVGSASGAPIAMHGGVFSEGRFALVTWALDAEPVTASVQFWHLDAGRARLAPAR